MSQTPHRTGEMYGECAAKQNTTQQQFDTLLSPHTKTHMRVHTVRYQLLPHLAHNPHTHTHAREDLLFYGKLSSGRPRAAVCLPLGARFAAIIRSLSHTPSSHATLSHTQAHTHSSAVVVPSK